ncbi:BldC family transcriptional regulator [Nonomuraea rosea]|uniref:BldC family transcriptional regulator n=1 Tax=Nonomuraea rosea TaxID=638574 RepID=A0ABP6WJK6_9ACTN
MSHPGTLPETLLRPDQVAKVFNVSPRTVSLWAWTGRLPSVRTPGGHYRFHPSVIHERATVDLAEVAS